VASDPSESSAVPGPPLPDTEVLVEVLKPRFNQLVVCLSHSWGGLEQVAASDAVDIGGTGLKVRVLVLEGSPIHEALAHRKEVTVLPIDFRPRNYFDFRMRKEIERHLLEGSNLIHSHQTSILGSIVPWLWRKPEVAMVVTRHIMCNHNKKNFFHRAIYRRLDALMVISQNVRLNVMDTHPIRERFIKVVNLGLDFDRFDPEKVNPASQRAAWGADGQTTVIGLVGRIDPAKGQGTFIKAAAGLLKNLKSGEKLKFVIVGEETLGSAKTHLAELKLMVSQFHLEDHVVFAGYHENIPEIMSSFDLFVMPSRQEAFGLVAIEAMAMECPIVLSSGGSADEIVGENERFGLTIRPDDAFDLQRQIRYLLDHPVERVQMGQRAREHVRRNYDRKDRLQKTLALYENAMRRRGI
jgi:glycosyltransferase involved in cell wall biosynthesis